MREISGHTCTHALPLPLSPLPPPPPPPYPHIALRCPGTPLTVPGAQLGVARASRGTLPSPSVSTLCSPLATDDARSLAAGVLCVHRAAEGGHKDSGPGASFSQLELAFVGAAGALLGRNVAARRRLVATRIVSEASGSTLAHLLERCMLGIQHAVWFVEGAAVVALPLTPSLMQPSGTSSLLAAASVATSAGVGLSINGEGGEGVAEGPPTLVLRPDEAAVVTAFGSVAGGRVCDVSAVPVDSAASTLLLARLLPPDVDSVGGEWT